MLRTPKFPEHVQSKNREFGGDRPHDNGTHWGDVLKMSVLMGVKHKTLQIQIMENVSLA